MPWAVPPKAENARAYAIQETEDRILVSGCCILFAKAGFCKRHIHMNNYFKNPLYRTAFFEDVNRIMAGFQKDYALLQSGENKKGAFKNIHRYAHSLKGLSAMMELADIGAIAENMESVLGRTLNENVFDLDADKMSKINDGFNKIAGLLQIIKNNSTD